MKHLGDITKINGAEIEPVDCITGGSPCQDLSVAGKRAGLAGERSGLFMEQIRIVKEMREHDRRIKRTDDDFRLRPRYMVWENVPGAFSSNKGEDFQAVLTEIVRIVRTDAPDVPLPDRGGWSKSGCIMGYGSTGCPFSIAWRLHDAQFWGVPQRRKRIALVADFGGLSASEVLFERKGLSGDFAESGTQGERTAGTAEKGTDSTIGFNRERNGAVTANGIMPTLQAAAGESGNNKPMVVYGISSYDSNAMKSNNPHSGIYKADTSRTLDLNGGSPACNQGGMCVLQSAGFDGNMGSKAGNIGYEEEMSPTLKSGGKMHVVTCLNDQGGSVMGISEDVIGALRAEEHGHQPIVYNGSQITSEINHSNPQPGDACHSLTTDSRNYVVEPIMVEMTSTKNTVVEDGVSPTLTARMGTGGNQVNALCMDVGFFQTSEEKVGALLARQYKDPPITYQDKTGSLLASGYEKNGTQEAANDMYITGNMVRRLTPLECERLQGFPDGWTDIGEWVDSKGKKHKESDSPRYKALGNSIAVGYANNGSGFWMWLLKRISAQYERNATLGSLFDGIGGFPLAWEHFNGKGSARWASEIEEFPIAVTKKHFPEPE